MVESMKNQAKQRIKKNKLVAMFAMLAIVMTGCGSYNRTLIDNVATESNIKVEESLQEEIENLYYHDRNNYFIVNDGEQRFDIIREDEGAIEKYLYSKNGEIQSYGEVKFNGVNFELTDMIFTDVDYIHPSTNMSILYDIFTNLSKYEISDYDREKQRLNLTRKNENLYIEVVKADTEEGKSFKSQFDKNKADLEAEYTSLATKAKEFSEALYNGLHKDKYLIEWSAEDSVVLLLKYNDEWICNTDGDSYYQYKIMDEDTEKYIISDNPIENPSEVDLSEESAEYKVVETPYLSEELVLNLFMNTQIDKSFKDVIIEKNSDNTLRSFKILDFWMNIYYTDIKEEYESLKDK